jgi:hypothetical protein
LGIKARFLSLKQEARSHSKEPKNAIVSALRLVVKSAKSVRRFARQLDALTQCRAPHHDAMKPGATGLTQPCGVANYEIETQTGTPT